MSDDKVIISLIEREQGMEVRINESAYGNLAVIGLLEKIKMTIMDNDPDTRETVTVSNKKSKSYDA